MAISAIEIAGNKARALVKATWPDASSAYTGATSAEVYDPVTETVLGTASALDFSVEHAWVDAANRMNNAGGA